MNIKNHLERFKELLEFSDFEYYEEDIDGGTTIILWVSSHQMGTKSFMFVQGELI